MTIRPARNELEVDFLPPFGEPEVEIFGEAAVVGGLLITGAIAAKILIQE